MLLLLQVHLPSMPIGSGSAILFSKKIQKRFVILFLIKKYFLLVKSEAAGGHVTSHITMLFFLPSGISDNNHLYLFFKCSVLS
jgi:hypothetical protein